MRLLDNVIQNYAWGSHSEIARLQGRPDSPKPEAELWMGAHTVAPSRLRDTGITLDREITADPRSTLGVESVAQFGPRLPFLLKVLAAEEPLSLQAHPNAAQAREGFAREDAQGIPRDAPTRSYRDESHKPELLCALTPMDALSGFRDAGETIRLFDALAVPSLAADLARLRSTPSNLGLRAMFERLMTAPSDEKKRISDETAAACARAENAEKQAGSAPSDFADAYAWAVKLGAKYPGDIGVACALMLHLIHLAPGDAIYLDAGNLHAYLHGTGVEIMAASDNVLRGGLTPKHVDVPALLQVLDFSGDPKLVKAARVGDEDVYETPAAEFRLARITLEGARVSLPRRGAEILLCIEGEARVTSGEGETKSVVSLKQGESGFVAASDPPYFLDGNAILYRASSNAL